MNHKIIDSYFYFDRNNLCIFYQTFRILIELDFVYNFIGEFKNISKIQ